MTTNPSSTFVVIAALNESSVVGDVITGVRRICRNVILVDDGSSDGTEDVALRAGAVVVHHATNLGQGAALQTGITYALRLGATAIVTFDADGQHDPEDIAPLLAALESGAGAALGSRFIGTAPGMPASRRLLVLAACWVNYFLTGVKLSDAHNGLRALSRRAATQLRLRQAGMAHATEIIAQIVEAKIKIVEVPVTIHYTPYSLAKGQKLSNSFHILFDLLLRGLSR